MAHGRQAKPTVAKALGALETISATFGAEDLATIARRALEALRNAPGSAEAEKVAALTAAASLADGAVPLNVKKLNNMLCSVGDFVYICEPKSAGVNRWRLVREAMAAAAKNSKLVEDVSKIEDPARELVESYVSRLSDSSLSLEDYPLVVEELLADSRLKAAGQREVIMRVTGYSKSLLGNPDNRRIALISWRRNKASDKYLFEARANEKRRF